jgi:hypothetical protein
MRLDASKSHHWVWYSRLDRRNGYLAWGPVGKPFNRKRLGHWLIAAVDLWRKGRR